MTTYAYLEHALTAEGAEAIQEDNKELLDHALRLVDYAVRDEHTFSESSIGRFIVEGSLEDTYDNIQTPTSDVVIESISVFADIISSTEYDVEEKKLLMECAVDLIGCEEDPMSLLTEDAMASMSALGTSVNGMFTSFADKIVNAADLIKNNPDVANAKEAISNIGDGADNAYQHMLDPKSVASLTYDAKSALSEVSKDLSTSFSNASSAVGQGLNASKAEVGKAVDWFATFLKDSGIDGTLRSGFTSVLDMVKENTNLGPNGAPAVAAGLVILTVIVVIFLAIKLWKMGKKRQALKMLGSARKVSSNFKSGSAKVKAIAKKNKK